MQDRVERMTSEANIVKEEASLVAERRTRLGVRPTLLVGILLFAFILRLAALPRGREMRDPDEAGYVSSGLVWVEGMSPGLKFTPGGPLMWTVWTITAAKTAAALVFPSPRTKSMPFQYRPFAAMEEALFEVYADLGILTRKLVSISIALSLAAVAALFELGRRRAGLPGAVVSAGLFAFMPILIDFSVVARPYSDAWSYAALAAFLAAIPARRSALIGCAIVMGLCMGDRLDMLLYLPLLAWSLRYEAGRSGRELGLWVVVVFVTMFISAPWFFTDILGNIRPIVAVRVFSSSMAGHMSAAQGLVELLWNQGMGLAVIGCIAGSLVAVLRSERHYKLLGVYFALLFANLVFGTGYGLRHQGAVLCGLVWVASLLLPFLRVRPAIQYVVAGAMVLPVFVRAAIHVEKLRAVSSDNRATEYIEGNVPPSTPVYISGLESHPPLPTSAASDRLWRDAADADAWRVKIRAGAEHYKLGRVEYPRALSEDHTAQERSNRRRWFILGANVDTQRPRYDIWLYSGGSPFDVPETHIVEQVKKTGGALIWRGGVIPEFEPAAAQWLGEDGSGTRVYVVTAS
jgi:hypothetical protein